MGEAIERILDANLDRAAEGVRVVEDVARFALDSPEWSDRLRALRHALGEAVRGVPGLGVRLVQARDSAGDVGRAAAHVAPHADLLSLVETNLGRAQEATRCLEEFARCLAPALAQAFAEVRFGLYDVERELVPLVQKKTVRDRLDFELYVVVTGAFCRGRAVPDVVREAIAGGARAVQLREKALPKGELYRLAKTVRDLVEPSQATLIVNDHLDVAQAVGADGVHLGQEDLPVGAARGLAGPGLVIGASTHDVQQARAALAAGADYINCGPVYPTQTKTGASRPVGLERVREYAALRDRTPGGFVFTTMGGIKADNVEPVVLAGADRVAVVTAVVAADDIAAAAHQLLEAIHRAKRARAAREENS